ncbi:Herpesviridae UL52/UL70 DNA primase [Trichostrongylus colubriformis]|uniref:DNA-directed primase/polymerase protein n=1 Tax=Trichostrongylus colubriformis TaxID=6319 RepID=A0AAN8EYR5_TRICO
MSRRSDPYKTTLELDSEDSFNDSVHLNDSWFYGPPKKKQVVANDARENMSPSPIRCRRASLVEKSFGELETFPKQRLALAKLAEHAKVFKNTRVFSFEMPGHSDGERRYLVSTLERFWLWYSSIQERHLYELITESTPCRLYFDLEYSKETNRDIDHEIVYRHFMENLQRLLKSEFDLETDPFKDFLVLDSSTKSKFSAHVICHLPGDIVFPSNTSMRPFCTLLADALLENSPVKIWNSDATRETVLFDSAVYSKNRNFRLFLSSKLGKNTVLKLAPYCSFYGSRKPSDQQIFYDSLCVPANAHKLPQLQIPECNHWEPPRSKEFAASVPKLEEGSGRSPYPQLDEFMLMVWRKWNQSVYIRQWKSMSNTGNDEERVTGIIYYPANCRYCFNIGRQHKSNGTFWIVNFERNDFCQKCFDPECRGVSSNLFPLPSFIADSLHKKDCEGANSEAKHAVTPFDEDDVASFFDESYTELNEFFTQWDDIFEQ